MKIYTGNVDAGLRVGFGRASLGKSNLLSWDVKEEMKCLGEEPRWEAPGYTGSKRWQVTYRD